jgi:integrase
LGTHTWQGGRRNAVVAVKRAFNWADRQSVLSPNPLRNVGKLPQGRRTRIVAPAEREEVLATVRDEKFRDFLKTLYLTGCRPSEVARVTAANLALALGVWVFEKHKTAKKTGKLRVVYLCPEMLEWSRELAAEGPLFPSYKLGRRRVAPPAGRERAAAGRA